MQTGFIFRLLIAVTLFGGHGLFAQLPSFTLIVSATAETCNGNGTLQMAVSGVEPAASVLFTIYQLPNATTPIAVTADNNLGGLTAGTYLVVATQSLGQESNSQQQNVSVINQAGTLQFTLAAQKAVCGNDGKITVSVTQGTGVSYEIFSGPEIFPLQASNVFPGLLTGTYQVRVFDVCGDGYVQTVNVGQQTPNITFRYQGVNGDSCDNVQALDYLESFGGTIIAYPITIVFNVTTGSSVAQYTQYLANGDAHSQSLSQLFPLIFDINYSYFLTVIDGCGTVYTSPVRTFTPEFGVSIGSATVGCDDKSFSVRLHGFGQPPFTVQFLQAPAGFDPSVYNPEHPGPFTTSTYATYYNQNIQLPAGTYSVQVTDACGNVGIASLNLIFQPLTSFPLSYYVREGCTAGFGSVMVYSGDGHIFDMKIISAPTSYPLALPHTVFSGDNNFIGINNLPAGTYVFQCDIICGQQQIVTVEIEGYHGDYDIEVIENCGSFDISIFTDDNSEGDLILQRQNSNGTWANVLNGTLDENAINYNFIQTGTFRIIRDFFVYSFPNEFEYCERELLTFEYTGAPRLNNIYSFACGDGLYSVLVEADGVAPFQYRIVEKDGLPFVLENGTVAIFVGLSPATYVFQVEDACGNIINRTFDIPQPFDFQITATQMCVGQPAEINAPDFSFLNYEWYSDANPTLILSTSSSLLFGSYQNSNDGLYHVHVSYTGNPNSCIDFVSDYQLNGNAIAQAGQDVSVVFCGDQGIVNLSALLSADAAAGGTWSVSTNAGQLKGSNWNSNDVAPGTYNFSYTVANCSTTDSASIAIGLQPKPDAPTVFLQQPICAFQDIQLFSSQVAGATYQWTGPNGFTSTDQNPVILNATSANSGTYSVQAFIGSCASEASAINITMGTLAEFTITAACNNDRMLLTATTTDATAGYSYSWSGPNNFTSSQNPADVTGNASGMYSLTVTNPSGCTAESNQNVGVTLCTIPQGVSANSDGANDSFDLSGFGENLKVKIFNRYGMVVYEMNNYVDQWHGQCKDGTLLPSATYYYHIQGDSVAEKTGWVYLLRND